MITCPKHEEKPKSCSGCRFEMDHYGDPKCMFDGIHSYENALLMAFRVGADWVAKEERRIHEI
mgnify:CR=1 FL=1